MRRRGLKNALATTGLVLLVAGLLVACMSATWTPGQRLFRSKCGACHLRPARTQHDRAGWAKVLDRHERRFPLTPAERKRLLDWLSARDDKRRPQPRR